MAGRGRGRNVSYVKQDEPAFLRRFKEKVGYDEGPSVETKRERLAQLDEDAPEQEDEKPVVVVLREGDLTAQQAEGIEQQDAPPDGRIMFKKPTKRSAEKESDSDLVVTTKKKKKESEKDKSKGKSKGIKNTKLLSFNEDEEEEEDG